MTSYPRIKTADWSQKRYHVKVAKQQETKSTIELDGEPVETPASVYELGVYEAGVYE